MIYMLCNDDNVLLTAPDMYAVHARCTRLGVAAGRWRFFDDDGQPLSPEFPRVPAGSAAVSTHGCFLLRVDTRGPALRDLLDHVSRVEDRPGLDSISAVRDRLDRHALARSEHAFSTAR